MRWSVVVAVGCADALSAGAAPPSFGEALTASRAEGVAKEVAASGLCVVDGLLGDEACAAMRAEAVDLLEGGALGASRSIVSGEEMDKKGVYATGLSLDADDHRPEAPPLMRAYLLALAGAFGGLGGLRPHARNNKLAATLDGGAYPLHLDNDGADASDARALTLIYYLNPTWAPDHAGEFFAVGAGWDFERRKVEPRGDRLVAFDSRPSSTPSTRPS